MRNILLGVIALGIWVACTLGANYMKKQDRTKEIEAVVGALKCPQ